MHCFGKSIPALEKDEVEVFTVDSSFYLKYVISQHPKDVEKVRSTQQNHITFTSEQFETVCSQINSKK
jgi:hypothetical protein